MFKGQAFDDPFCEVPRGTFCERTSFFPVQSANAMSRDSMLPHGNNLCWQIRFRRAFTQAMVALLPQSVKIYKGVGNAFMIDGGSPEGQATRYNAFADRCAQDSLLPYSESAIRGLTVCR
jgi:hypothetical protein